jgi:hypothetical protein
MTLPYFYIFVTISPFEEEEQTWLQPPPPQRMICAKSA